MMNRPTARIRFLPQRVFSVLFCLCYVFVNHMPAPVFAQSSPSAIPGLSREIFEDVTAIRIPKQIGEVQEFYRGSDDKIVVLIQDAHSIPDAQNSIRAMIKFFQQTYGFDLTLLEGASTELDSRIFQSFPDRELLKQTFQEYLRRGELTGGTAASVFNQGNNIYHGIENWKMYEDQIDAYLDSVSAESEILAELSEAKQLLNERKAAAYSIELLKVDRAITAFQEENMNLTELLRILNQSSAPEKGSKLEAIVALSSESSGDELDFEVKRLAQKVKTALQSVNPEPETLEDIREFNQAYQQFSLSAITPEAFALILRKLIGKYRIPVQVSQRLNTRVGKQKTMRDIRGTQLFKELEAYEVNVKESLFRNDDQRMLDREGRNIELLERLASLELNQDDWQQIQKTALKIDSWIVRTDGILTQSILRDLFGKLRNHFEFYRIAHERDLVFFRQALETMKKYSRSKSILISGGFHTEGLTRQFRTQGISYVLASPSIDAMPDQHLYREHMRGEVSWREYFKVENGKVNLYEAFVRGTRDYLLTLSTEKRGVLLKKWRDQIIRDLANDGEIDTAGQYLRFIDEVQERSGKSQKIRENWMQEIERFVDGMQRLNDEGRLTEANVRGLMRPASLAAEFALAGALARNEIRSSALRFVVARSTISQAVVSGQDDRSEQRSQDKNAELEKALEPLIADANRLLAENESAPQITGVRITEAVDSPLTENESFLEVTGFSPDGLLEVKVSALAFEHIEALENMVRTFLFDFDIFRVETDLMHIMSIASVKLRPLLKENGGDFTAAQIEQIAQFAFAVLEAESTGDFAIKAILTDAVKSEFIEEATRPYATKAYVDELVAAFKADADRHHDADAWVKLASAIRKERGRLSAQNVADILDIFTGLDFEAETARDIDGQVTSDQKMLQRLGLLSTKSGLRKLSAQSKTLYNITSSFNMIITGSTDPADLAAGLSAFASAQLESAAPSAVLTPVRDSPALADLARQAPGIVNLLNNQGKAAVLFNVLSAARSLFHYEQTAENDFEIALGNNLFARVDTSSFRRHILIEKNRSGEIVAAVEIKIPGDLKHKAVVSPNDYDVGVSFSQQPGLENRYQKALGVFQYPDGDYSLYGMRLPFRQPVTPEEAAEKAPVTPLFAVISEYDMTHHAGRTRLSDKFFVRNNLTREHAESVARQVQELLIRVTEAGYAGSTDFIHLESFHAEMVDGQVQLTLVNDFHGFKKAENAEEIKENARQSYYGFLKELDSIFKKRGFNIDRNEIFNPELRDQAVARAIKNLEAGRSEQRSTAEDEQTLRTQDGRDLNFVIEFLYAHPGIRGFTAEDQNDFLKQFSDFIGPQAGYQPGPLVTDRNLSGMPFFVRVNRANEQSPNDLIQIIVPASRTAAVQEFLDRNFPQDAERYKSMVVSYRDFLRFRGGVAPLRSTLKERMPSIKLKELEGDRQRFDEAYAQIPADVLAEIESQGLEVIGHVGQGGYGNVFAVETTVNGTRRIEALKIINRDTPELKEKFLTEVITAAIVEESLPESNLPRVFGTLGESRDVAGRLIGVSGIRMELKIGSNFNKAAFESEWSLGRTETEARKVRQKYKVDPDSLSADYQTDFTLVDDKSENIIVPKAPEGFYLFELADYVDLGSVMPSPFLVAKYFEAHPDKKAALGRLEMGGYIINDDLIPPDAVPETQQPAAEQQEPQADPEMEAYWQEFLKRNRSELRSTQNAVTNVRIISKQENPEEYARQFETLPKTFIFNNFLSDPRNEIYFVEVSRGSEKQIFKIFWHFGSDDSIHQTLPRSFKPYVSVVNEVIARSIADVTGFYDWQNLPKSVVIENSTGFGLEQGNYLGVRISGPATVNPMIEAIDKSDGKRLIEQEAGFRASLAHEYVHNHREDGVSFGANKNVEVITQLIQFLYAPANNPDFRFLLDSMIEQYQGFHQGMTLDGRKTGGFHYAEAAISLIALLADLVLNSEKITDSPALQKARDDISRAFAGASFAPRLKAVLTATAELDSESLKQVTDVVKGDYLMLKNDSLQEVVDAAMARLNARAGRDLFAVERLLDSGTIQVGLLNLQNPLGEITPGTYTVWNDSENAFIVHEGRLVKIEDADIVAEVIPAGSQVTLKSNGLSRRGAVIPAGTYDLLFQDGHMSLRPADTKETPYSIDFTKTSLVRSERRAEGYATVPDRPIFISSELAEALKGAYATLPQGESIPPAGVFPEGDIRNTLLPKVIQLEIDGVPREFNIFDAGTQGVVYRNDETGKVAKLFFLQGVRMAPEHLQLYQEVNNALIDEEGLPVTRIDTVAQVKEGLLAGHPAIIRDFRPGISLGKYALQNSKSDYAHDVSAGMAIRLEVELPGNEAKKELVQTAEATLDAIDAYTKAKFGFELTDRRINGVNDPDDLENFVVSDQGVLENIDAINVSSLLLAFYTHALEKAESLDISLQQSLAGEETAIISYRDQNTEYQLEFVKRGSIDFSHETGESYVQYTMDYDSVPDKHPMVEMAMRQYYSNLFYSVGKALKGGQKVSLNGSQAEEIKKSVMNAILLPRAELRGADNAPWLSVFTGGARRSEQRSQEAVKISDLADLLTLRTDRNGNRKIMNVLVAEDQKERLNKYRELLRNLGIVVHAFDNGIDAYKSFLVAYKQDGKSPLAFDLVITDRHMPADNQTNVMTGDILVDVIRQAEVTRGETPVIVISAEHPKRLSSPDLYKQAEAPTDLIMSEDEARAWQNLEGAGRSLLDRNGAPIENTVYIQKVGDPLDAAHENSFGILEALVAELMKRQQRSEQRIDFSLSDEQVLGIAQNLLSDEELEAIKAEVRLVDPVAPEAAARLSVDFFAAKGEAAVKLRLVESVLTAFLVSQQPQGFNWTQEALAAVNAEAKGLVASALNLRDRNYTVGLSLPADVEGQADLPLLNNLLRIAEEGSNLSEIPLSGKLSPQVQGRLEKSRVVVRSVNLRRSQILLNDQPAVPLLVVSQLIEKVDEMFVPLKANFEDVSDPIMIDYAELLRSVAAMHMADLLAQDATLLKDADRLKDQLLTRLQMFGSSFENILTKDGDGWVIQGAAARAYLEMRIAEAMAASA